MGTRGGAPPFCRGVIVGESCTFKVSIVQLMGL